MSEPLDLAAIKTRCEKLGPIEPGCSCYACELTRDVPALVAEVERLNTELAKANATIMDQNARLNSVGWTALRLREGTVNIAKAITELDHALAERDSQP